MAVTVAGARRIDFLSVPVHDLPEENLDSAVREMLERGGKHQIVLVETWDLIRARHNQEYARILNNASLVIPVTRGIGRVCRFLKRPVPATYMPFDFIIKLLGCLERYGKSVYLLGSTHANIQVSTSNLRTSFPGINIVGRCSGYYKRPVEENILLAIRKASPSLLLVGRGVKNREKWLLENRSRLSDGMYIYCGDCFDIFAGKKKRIPRDSWEKGRYLLPLLIKRPWRTLRIFGYLLFSLAMLSARIRKA
ncbi:WecB/TagA/CpsF family glycosyltransferase [Marispirochaeta sp.]|uniref:WecB/TagA/CpsF family glycosyltransferase n=1 Tax=Marispirochaeta sp. TaxID=2038653 RepID=UPI0029C943F6|nr:WecB/TagA/CpsF family glycosyltransferase [Marispirochaeta sp.]